MSARLAVTDLTLARGGRILFAGLSFAVAAGGAALVRGPNGAGKSSLLRAIAGIGPADTRGGTAIARPASVALMNEAPALDRDRTLGAALAFWAALDARPDAAARVAAALEDTGLSPLADVPVRMLSAGQTRRAALARVLAARADLWLLDEPANGLDAASVARLEAAIARHRAAGGIVVVATHQPVTLPDAVTVTLAAAPEADADGDADGDAGEMAA